MNSISLATTFPCPPRARSSFAHVCLASCRKLLGQLARVKSSILTEFRGRLHDHEHVLELALNEAEALAWQSGFPQLLYPALANEKAQSVAQWHSHQQSVRRHSSVQAVAA